MKPDVGATIEWDGGGGIGDAPERERGATVGHECRRILFVPGKLLPAERAAEEGDRRIEVGNGQADMVNTAGQRLVHASFLCPKPKNVAHGTASLQQIRRPELARRLGISPTLQPFQETIQSRAYPLPPLGQSVLHFRWHL